MHRINSVLSAVFMAVAVTGCAADSGSARSEIAGPLVDPKATVVVDPKRNEKIDDIKLDLKGLQYKLDNKSYSRYR